MVLLEARLDTWTQPFHSTVLVYGEVYQNLIGHDFFKAFKKRTSSSFQRKKQENIAVYRKDAIYTQNDQLEHMYCNSNITADSTCLRASFFLHRHEL